MFNSFAGWSSDKGLTCFAGLLPAGGFAFCCEAALRFGEDSDCLSPEALPFGEARDCLSPETLPCDSKGSFWASEVLPAGKDEASGLAIVATAVVALSLSLSSSANLRLIWMLLQESGEGAGRFAGKLGFLMRKPAQNDFGHDLDVRTVVL